MATESQVGHFDAELSAIYQPSRGVRDLVTLGDAARFILALGPAQSASACWKSCAAAVVLAARTGRRGDIAIASANLERALRREGWLAPGAVIRRRRIAATLPEWLSQAGRQRSRPLL
jgi:hypothetical protein